ncbi:SCO family protein [Flavobacteriaceae bacterium]|nr:SCO family protein [Flavobacteriaceae bacterium]MDA9016034.1 SCO family protein [Flavobacteriaceae bacterium]
MKFNFKKYRGFIAIFTIVSLGILALFYSALKPQKRLPIYQPSMVNFELVDSTLQHVKKYHKIAPFSLTNQNGETVTEQDYQNKIYVADFFFTTCPTICPKMTANMGQLQNEFLKDPQIQFLSFSVTPQIDSVQQLKKYAIEKGVIDSKWNLVTGNKKEIYTLARKSYLAVKDTGDGGQFDMIHTENFILVDPEQRIRGFYDGTDMEAMQTLIADISTLKEEFLKQ